MASRTMAQSSAVRAIGPILSSVHESAMAPCRETRPYVGRSPVIPQNDEGQTIDPQVSEPTANGRSRADTAAPDPDDDPHVHRPVSQGLRAAPVREAPAMS